MPVLDVVAERVEADLGRGESAPPARARAAPVASTIRITRSGAACAGAAGPDAERLQRGDGTGQQRGGAMVRGRPARDQRGFDAGLGQRNRGGQPGRAAADDRHLDG